MLNTPQRLKSLIRPRPLASTSRQARPDSSRACSLSSRSIASLATGRTRGKGKINLHTLDGDLATGHELERWELVLEMLESGEMPPREKPQPSAAARATVARWIDAGLRDYLAQASEISQAPTTRRLTNFEYQNTLRDLLGFELQLIGDLAKDPVKPYEFNNTAELMRIGPEQLERYLECARRAMASAIVDPGKPEVHRTRHDWKPHDLDKGPLSSQELGMQLAHASISIKPAYVFTQDLERYGDYFRIGRGEGGMPVALEAFALFVEEHQEAWRDPRHLA